MEKHIKNIICLFLLTALIVTAAQAQVLPDVQSSLNQYNSTILQEKVFVNTDKNAYTIGELIWFKVYNVDAANHQPLDLSKVVYVEILDNNHNAVLQAKIGMVNGTGAGSLYVPVTLSTGNYLLRAYTSWMKNFSADYYFSKKISIVNPLKSPEIEAKATPVAEYDAQFFPEGGNLVNGISSIVGFKVTDQWGKSVNFKGAILNKTNDTIARFEPYRFGMGHFTFKPDNHNSYHAVIKIGNKIIQKDLPAITDNGYVMSVKNNGAAQLTVTVNTNINTQAVYLFVHTRGLMKAAESAAVNNGTAVFNIDKSKLGDGISHLTIFNSQRQPVCERLYFKLPAKKLLITAAADQQQYSTRKKVTIAIDAKNESNKQVASDLSLSVYRLDSLQHPSQENIQNYLWLSSDLKGNIESPDYYFNAAETDEAADNLMLTQGWSRFNWKSILNNQKPNFDFLPEFNGPIITAKSVNVLTNQPEKNVITYLAIPGKRVQLYTSITDSLGKLTFNMKDFYGPGEIIIENNTRVDTIHHVEVLSPFSEQYAKITVPRLSLTPGMQTSVEDQNMNTQVQNIYNSTKLRQFYDPKIDSSAFYGQPFKTYVLDNYTRFTTMEEVMREYVSEINLIHSKNYFHIKVLADNQYLSDDDPLILIDGVPMFDANKLFAADPLKIYKLEDMPFTYYWGPAVAAGIFSYTSYKGDLGGVEIDPHAVVMDYEGLELQREFYSPIYDTDKASASHMPDFRNVLYWEPYVTTSTQGKNSLSFYTSDKTGQYIGVIQGLTGNGEAGSSSFNFTVVK
jgi:hypothetical protein